MRKRPSGARLDGVSGVSNRDRHGTGGWRYYQQASSMPTWQVLLLLAAALGALYLVLSHTNPRARAAQVVVGHSNTLKCFPLKDEEAARLLGADKAYSRAIVTASARSQTLFDLGMLAAHGFNQLEAAAWFQAAVRADPACAMCHWGLAYVQGPTPNKPPGKLGDKFPSFQATHATDALGHIQTAVQLSTAATTAAAAVVSLSQQTDQQQGQPPLAAAADDVVNKQQKQLLLLRREQALIQAMAERFATGAAALKAKRWWQHEEAYAARLEQLGLEQTDADIYALAAEAYMNLSPWDYYNTTTGQLRPTAAAAERLLLAALALNPQHTHALHLHIHITEAGTPGEPPSLPSDAPPASNSAARGLSSAESLLAVAPPNGHLLHMPSHTLVRVGQYRRAVEANKAAYAFDVSRGAQCIVPYLPEHNVGMLVYSASMAGMYHTATRYARGMRNLRDRVPDVWVAKGSEWASLPLLLIRFGHWEELLAQPTPPRDARGVTAYGGPQFALVVHHTGRLLALAAKAHAATQQLLGLHDVTAFDLARKSVLLREKEVAHEHQLLKAAIRSVPHETPTKPGPPPGIYASAYTTLAAILGQLANARVALLHNNTASAVDALTEAVALEDALGYMEPPRVHQPSRQCLGWVLMTAGRLEEAAAVYKQDLQEYPRNGWSQLGLLQVSKAAAGSSSDVGVLEQRWLAAWADAEVQIASSCPALAEPFAA